MASKTINIYMRTSRGGAKYLYIGSRIGCDFYSMVCPVQPEGLFQLLRGEVLIIGSLSP